MKLNKTEIVIGAVHGAWTVFWIDLWLGLALTVATAVLFALGGAGEKMWRRIGVPAAVGGVLLVATGNWWVVLAGCAGFGVLSIGYGLPSKHPYDEGSALGRYVFENMNLVPHNRVDEIAANVIIRGGLWFVFVLPFATALKLG